MGSKGSTQVQPVDPWEVGRADATFNRINTYTPFGSLEYSGPNRNVANLRLNPYLADNENRRIFSDRMLLDSALSRQAAMANGGLPSLTTGINPGALQEYFGLPSQLQQGFDTQANPPMVPDAIGAATGPVGGGAQPMAKGGSKPSQGVGDIGGTTQTPQQKGGQPPMQESQQGPLFGGTVGSMFDPSTFGQIGSLDQLEPFNLDRGRVEQNYYDRASSLLNPQFDQAEQRMVSDLRARGIPRDSEAFQREMDNFRRSKGETFGRLANDAVLQGGGEQSRLFGLSSALGDRAQNAQSQLFNMADQLSQRDIQAQLQNANIASMNRATQFNELASLLGLQQVASPGLNNFFAPGNVDMTGNYALQQQGLQGNANRNAAMKGGALGGLTDLGSAAIGAGGVPKVGGGK